MGPPGLQVKKLEIQRNLETKRKTNKWTNLHTMRTTKSARRRLGLIGYAGARG
jgi:hypothetical protein